MRDGPPSRAGGGNRRSGAVPTSCDRRSCLAGRRCSARDPGRRALGAGPGRVPRRSVLPRAGRASHRSHPRAPHARGPPTGRSRRRPRRGASAPPPNRTPSRRPRLPVARLEGRQRAHLARRRGLARPARGSAGTSPCRSPRARRPRAQAAATATDRARPTHRACALRSVRCQQPCWPRSLRGPRVFALRSPSPSRVPRCQRRTSPEQASGRLRRDVGRGMHLSALDQLRSGRQRRIEHEPPGREWALPLGVTSEPSRDRATLLARLVHRLLPSCRAPKRLESGSGL